MTDSDPSKEGGPKPPSSIKSPLPREEDAPRALLIALIVTCLIIVTAAYYAIEKSDLAGGVIGEPASFGSTDPILRLEEILEERQKGNLLGRDVALWHVPVDRVVGDYMFWIGSRQGRDVPVMLLGEQTSRQNEEQSAVNRGDTLAVIGTIRAVREVRHLDELWAMDEEEFRRLEQAAIYVSAIRVEHLVRAEGGGSTPDASER